MDKHELLPFIKQIVELETVEFLGIHAHIGSQIFDTDPYHDLVNIMVNYMEQIEQTLGVSVKELDLGGGFGIQYIQSDDPPNVRDVLKPDGGRFNNDLYG